jgi:cysteinyl-tRNA synthetase
MAASSRIQAPWAAPHGNDTNIRVYNSLTRDKVPFIRRGKTLTWYACGPTVYDDASTDIVRRILQDYFEFDVKFVMNITDLDDKIILRGRQRFLYEEWQKKHRYVREEELNIVKEAYEHYIRTNLPLLSRESAPAPQNFEQEVMASVYGNVLAKGSQKAKHTMRIVKRLCRPSRRISTILFRYLSMRRSTMSCARCWTTSSAIPLKALTTPYLPA